MAINEKAKNHYDLGVVWLQAAVEAASKQQINAAIAATGIATACKDFAQFCVDNHALVNGVPDDAPISVRSAGGGPKLWGPVPP
jgi:hypothetical protein